MKELTYQELLEAPHIVQFLYVRGIFQQAVGSKMLNEAIEKHPEYFPDEVQLRQKWSLIPQRVHDAYLYEIEQMRKAVFKDMPPSKGILGWLDDPEGYKAWREAYDKFRPIEETREKEIHKKYYGPYGL